MLYPPPFLSPLMFCQPKFILECLWTDVFGQSSSHGAWEAESGALFHCCSGESPLSKTTATEGSMDQLYGQLTLLH